MEPQVGTGKVPGNYGSPKSKSIVDLELVTPAARNADLNQVRTSLLRNAETCNTPGVCLSGQQQHCQEIGLPLNCHMDLSKRRRRFFARAARGHCLRVPGWKRIQAPDSRLEAPPPIG